MYRRFIAPALTFVFEQIGATNISDKAKRYHKRRAWNRGGGYSYKPNGAKECERRAVQIAENRLTVSNGLSA
jgi:hypothetical protein